MRQRQNAAIAALALLAGAVAGCSLFSREPRFNPGAYETELNRWVGRPESELINTWGVPSKSQLLSGGGQVLQYDTLDGDKLLCTTLFASNITGTIERWRWSGDRCKHRFIDTARR
jgi:hypothetical protein